MSITFTKLQLCIMFEYVLYFQHQLITHQLKEWLCLNNECQLVSRTVNSKFGHGDQIQFQGYMSMQELVKGGQRWLWFSKVVKCGQQWSVLAKVCKE